MEYKGIIMDDFQVHAVEELKSDNSVVVAAPTGCGKTLIAEYLLDNFLKEGERAIYTAPIKALSNQKYRDFSKLYGDKVGMLTGDISINQGAQILIMTTEIFRNMLFAEKEELSDVKYVIFDEIHYINDVQRGVIWEESIIFALPHMRFCCLSATIPNADELAGWIENIKGHKVTLIEKKERPVPLYHNIYTKKLGMIPTDKFLNKLTESSAKKYARKFTTRDILDLVHRLKKQELLPSIGFVFSREGCFKFAKEVSKEIDFLTKDEKKIVSEKFKEVVDKYKISNIRSVDMLRRFAMNGVGVHNAGILPPLKEVIEVLFGMGLLKVIFVTETFAVGINMPAKACFFVSLEKYDGVQFRYLKNNEYFQMAGRAGRRGIDEKGYVASIIESTYLKMDEIERIMDETKLEPLESQFKLSYNTVLNLIDQYDMDKIREILNMSFAQYLSDLRQNKINKQMQDKEDIIQKTKEKIFCKSYQDFKNYQAMLRKKHRFNMKIKDAKQKIHDKKTAKRLIKKLRIEVSKSTQHLNRIEKKLSKVRCVSCEFSPECKKIGNRLRTYNKSIDSIQKYHSENNPDHYTKFLKRYEFLEKNGYIENGNLTTRGKVGSRIYGYELMVTELAMDGVFNDYTPDELNVLCACMIYEINLKKDFNSRIERNEMYYTIKRAKRIVNRIRNSEIKLGLEPSKAIYLDIITAAEAWSKGAEFRELLELTYLSEGDIIRLFRQVIDLLQQIKRVFIDDTMLVEKVHEALDKINRDIVNVSEHIGE